MKKIFRWLIPLVFCFFLTIGSDVSAQTVSYEKIEKFYTDISFTKNDTVKISETIEYDFGTNNRHGIYRTIPTKYSINRFPYNIRLYDIDVTDENNNPYPFTITHTTDGLNIKVGDPNKFVSGKKTYVFKYTIRRVWLYQNNQDTFYWNATGNEWRVPINEAHTTIYLPQKVKTSGLQASCTEGPRGSSNKCNYENLNNNNGETSKIEFAQNNLKQYQGTTVLIILPKNIIEPPSLLSNVLWTIRDNWVLTIPVFVLIIMFIIWYKKGRDPKGSPIIIPEYDSPDKLTPAEIGTIVDMKITSKELTAQIVSLAIRGYLTIERIEADGKNILVNDFKLIRTEKTADDLQFWEQALLVSIFSGTNGILLSQLKYNFEKDFQTLQRNVYKSLTDRGYFSANPQFFIQVASGVAGSFFIALYLLLKTGVSVLEKFWQPILSLFLSAGIFALFFNAMSKRTEKGVKAKEHILGLKEYLTVAEKDRIEFHNAPEKNIQKYEALLPFAIALGVESQWAKYFADLASAEYHPSWYLNTRTHNLFTPSSFANEINSFRTIAANNLMATRSGGGSGGGGRSGRGFGGGGGGSW